MADHPSLALEAEDGDRGGAEDELAAAVRPQPDPAPGELPEEVGVGEEQRVAARGQRALDHPVRTGGELLERLPAGAGVAPHVPARPLDADLLRGAALVLAVVALAEVA